MSQLTLSSAEEDYVKAIFKISERDPKAVHTNTIAAHLKTTAASVTDMIKRLSTKGIINYERYYGVTLTNQGQRMATMILRRNRLWEVFLVSKLRFPWHQVSNISDALEHVSDEDLILRLDAFLDYPKFDPHGDPIPNAEGRFTIRSQMSLSELFVSQQSTVLGVKDDSKEFLQYLSQINIKLGAKITIMDITRFDRSMMIKVENFDPIQISKSSSASILVKMV